MEYILVLLFAFNFALYCNVRIVAYFMQPFKQTVEIDFAFSYAGLFAEVVTVCGIFSVLCMKTSSASTGFALP